MQKILLLGASGLVGRALADALQEMYQIIPAAGHHAPECGYRLPADDPDRLLEVLDREDPEIAVSAIRGNYRAQMAFHVGTTDMTDYFAFEQMVCKKLGIPLPAFGVERPESQAYQAVLPARQEIPDVLQLTVTQVLDALNQ